MGLLASVDKGVSNIEKSFDAQFSLFSHFLVYYFALNETAQNMSSQNFDNRKIAELIERGEKKRDFFMEDFKEHFGDTKTSLKEVLVADYLFQKVQKVQKEENND